MQMDSLFIQFQFHDIRSNRAFLFTDYLHLSRFPARLPLAFNKFSQKCASRSPCNVRTFREEGNRSEQLTNLMSEIYLKTDSSSPISQISDQSDFSVTTFTVIRHSGDCW